MANSAEYSEARREATTADLDASEFAGRLAMTSGNALEALENPPPSSGQQRVDPPACDAQHARPVPWLADDWAHYTQQLNRGCIKKENGR